MQKSPQFSLSLVLLFRKHILLPRTCQRIGLDAPLIAPRSMNACADPRAKKKPTSHNTAANLQMEF